MKHVLNIVLTAAALLGFLGCDITSQEGSVRISFSREGRNIWMPDEGTLVISSYTITLSGPESREYTFTGVDPAEEFRIDALQPGSWTLTIEGFNEDSQKVARLAKNDQQEHAVNAFIRRGRVTEVEASVVPVADATGSLEVTLDWRDVDEQLIASFPVLKIDMENMNSLLKHYDAHTGTETISFNGSTADITDGTVEQITLSSAAKLQELTFTDLPAGLYRITLGLYSAQEPTEGERYWQGIWFAYVVGYGDATSGVAEILDPQLEKGSLDLSVIEDLNPPIELTVQKDKDPVSLNEEVTFTMTGYTPDTPIYRWYINGDLKSDTASLVYTFTEKGTYSVVLSLFDEGSWGSAVMEVVVE